jgi:pimeloyl-ACP methyl ester carboxylesterase
LGLDDFVTIAWSGGGPRAFACAAVLADRCRAAASLASPVPPDAEELAQVAGMNPENAALYDLAAKDQRAFTAVLEQQLAPLRTATDDQLRDWFRKMLAAPDRAGLAGELGEYLVACMRHSVHQGVAGWRDDLLTYSRPWGFDVSQIGVPVSVWHGTEDENLGSAHAIWFSEHVPGGRLHLLDGEGHISLILRIDDILDDLLERASV